MMPAGETARDAPMHVRRWTHAVSLAGAVQRLDKPSPQRPCGVESIGRFDRLYLGGDGRAGPLPFGGQRRFHYVLWEPTTAGRPFFLAGCRLVRRGENGRV